MFNYVEMATFGMLLALRCAQNIYFYFVISDQGNVIVEFSANQDKLGSSELIWAYSFRFLTNLYDFVLVLIFYNHILRMYDFWDQLFLESVEIELHDPELRDTEKRVQLERDYVYAKKHLERSQRFIRTFDRIYISFNLWIFVAQIFYIYDNPHWSRLCIMVFGIILFLMDAFMVKRFFVTINRFILLLTQTTLQKLMA